MGHNDPVEILSSDLTLDEALAAAVEFALEAVATEVGADRVGGHLEVAMEDARLATHLFDCTSPGYRGWRWAVTLARTSSRFGARSSQMITSTSAGLQSIEASMFCNSPGRL